MLSPVVQALSGLPEIHSRVVSLCEFRGIATPMQRFAYQGVELVRVLPFRFRSTSMGTQTSSKGSSKRRAFVRQASWHVLLQRPLTQLHARRPDLVILPNDGAFPYNHIVAQLHARRIPYLLLQESIRFALPVASEKPYGSVGAQAIAAWGETSAEYFLSVGVARAAIHLTGNPRFDSILSTDWDSESVRIRNELGLGDNTLLFISNPIDDQGFCTTAEKFSVLRRFVEQIGELLERERLQLVIKLHGRESLASCNAALEGTAHRERVIVTRDAPLYALLHLSRAAIVMASTAGLEALLFGIPLGVLEIPGHGFIFDFVSSGAAMGLHWQSPLRAQVKTLVYSRPTAIATRYIERNLAVRAGSTERVVQLATGMVMQHA